MCVLEHIFGYLSEHFPPNTPVNASICDMMNSFSAGNGILVLTSNHLLLLYGIGYYNSPEVVFLKYDTNDPNAWVGSLYVDANSVPTVFAGTDLFSVSL